MTRHLATAGSALLAAAIVAGCAAAPASRPPAPFPGQLSSAAVAGPTGSAPADDAEEPGPTTDVPVPAQAGQAATAFVVAWARPDLDPATWLTGVTAFATPEFAAELATVNPPGVPARAVTGAAVIGTATVDGAEVEVSTDAGPIRVVLVVRGGRWLVADLRPPEARP